jgi:hypothetical protein
MNSIVSPLFSRPRRIVGMGRNGAFVVAMLLSFAPMQALSQNPLEQLKQNLSKAKDQMKRAVKPAQQPAVSSTEPLPAEDQDASAAPPATPVSDVTSQSTSSGAAGLAGLLNGTASPSVPTSTVGNSPPVPMPDIEGIRLGMSMKDATAALQAAYPGARQSSGTQTLPLFPSPFTTGFGVGLELGSTLSDKFIVNVTPPPDNQVVYHVWRYVNNQHLYRDNLIAALRQKYGSETARFVGSARTDEAHATEFVWLFDQNGHPAPLPNTSDLSITISDCAGKFGVAAVTVPAFGGPNLTSPADRQMIQPGGWCNSALIALIANFNADQILTVYTEQLINIPAVAQSARDELTAIDNYQKQLQQKAIQSSKQQKPKL